ncbi:MAG TPA: tRNA (adenosine(37)-N6)-threonylcarbamoyltransferase complex transferase subunit TsaD [Firmicutes bacterium]|nr:tRNA (adenosine(37)-N6)-threonylcarbamoyltransferase complex transferase subunit TsaD [Bacillota bacterium]
MLPNLCSCAEGEIVLKVMGIETSCDETSVSVYDGKKVLSNVIFSQIKFHEEYGGVVPEIAAREHLNKLPLAVDRALEEAACGRGEIGGIAVTYGPGLAGALITGLSYAKAMAYALGVKYIGINHLEAHLLSPFLEFDDFDFPFLGIVVSGGHTNFYIAKKFSDYELIASTRDDAAGEAFDKVAKMLGLPYPGGPAVSAAAEKGNAKSIVFPQARMKDSSFDFSFSGLKTSVLYYVRDNKKKIEAGEVSIGDIAASFQKTVARSILSRIKKVCAEYGLKTVAMSGGVAANRYLKEEIKKYADSQKISFYTPSPVLCTDNGAMIAYAGYQRLIRGEFSEYDLEAAPSLKI